MPVTRIRHTATWRGSGRARLPPPFPPRLRPRFRSRHGNPGTHNPRLPITPWGVLADGLTHNEHEHDGCGDGKYEPKAKGAVGCHRTFPQASGATKLQTRVGTRVGVAQAGLGHNSPSEICGVNLYPGLAHLLGCCGQMLSLASFLMM